MRFKIEAKLRSRLSLSNERTRNVSGGGDPGWPPITEKGEQRRHTLWQPLKEQQRIDDFVDYLYVPRLMEIYNMNKLINTLTYIQSSPSSHDAASPLYRTCHQMLCK